MVSKTFEKGVSLTEFMPISSKGQLVIPKSMRTALGLKEGDVLATTLVGKDMVVLKKFSISLTKNDIATLEKIQEAWNDIDSGRGKRMSKDAFLKELSKW